MRGFKFEGRHEVESFKEEARKIEDCPLAKLANGKTFDKPMSAYNKPLALFIED